VQQVPRGSTHLFMQYQVLARKWRPQNFRELVGQEHVSRTLLNALQIGRVAHAFLFSGPRGCGKTTAARILAKALNCHGGQPGEPCGNCPACTEIVAGNCIDVLEIDAASKTGVDDVRQLIEQSRYNPARDRNKIFIIDEVHMLSNAAFAALLKTLEEPPSHVVFIMATTEYHKIPATILSRCQQYSFKLIQYPLILLRLQEISKIEGIQISNSALDQVVFSSGGSMRDAMSALDQVIAFSGNLVRDEDVATLLGLVEPKVLGHTVLAIAQNDASALLRIVGDLVEAGQDLNNFCRRLSGQFRNLMVLKTGIADPSLLGIPESLLPDLRKQADLFSREDLLRLFDSFQKIETGMKYATQVRFQLEMGLIELAHIARLRSLEELVAEFASIAEGETAKEPKTAADLPLAPQSTSQTVRQSAPRPNQKPASVPDVKAAASAEAAASEKVAAPGSKLQTAIVPPTLEISEGFPAMDPRDLLRKIAAAVGKESLEPSLQSMDGARLQGQQVVLEVGSSSDFARRQIKENLPAIAEAAAKIVGNKVTVVMGAAESKPAPKSQARRDKPPENNILEIAKREPVVRSFLDVFPGPVKAEKIDT
jgi:DNA polymerase III subunit gamma/tau